ncbi:MAG: tRNA (N(6)-L-threonylcarbamoyladenosine(37)-C(2))-methylthiotransferase [Candidatus Nanoarchaeia archaeon]
MHKIAFITFGCSLNQADSEAMAGLLSSVGYDVVEDADSANLVVVNSCTVKNLAESKFFKIIKDLELKNKKIVVAGCIPQADRKLVEESLKDYSIVGTSQLKRIVEVVEQTMEGNVIHYLQREKNPRLDLPKIRKNEIIDIIPISEGCLDACAYCKTKHARGSLLSYDPEMIVQQVRDAVKDGCKEIWMTSQDTGCYGFDIDTSLPELMKRVLSIEGDYMVRMGMMNPHHVLNILENMIDIYKNPRVFKFLHIPVQSGNDIVLGKMGRRYSVEEYKQIIKKIKKEVPGITISTDIICGFPEETREQFEDTVRLIKETEPDVLNISRFWLRPGTPAENLEQLHGRDTKSRSTELKNIFYEMMSEENQKYVGKEYYIIVDEKGKGDSWIGHNEFYKHIVVKGNLILGDRVKVKITGANQHYLLASEIPR